MVLQLLGTAVVIAYDVVMTYLILKLVSLITPLRASMDELVIGDREMRGEVAYDEFAFASQGDAERAAVGTMVNLINNIRETNGGERQGTRIIINNC